MKSSKEKQDQRKAELQAAALRDGFETWSQALTAWKNGEARLTKEIVMYNFIDPGKYYVIQFDTNNRNGKILKSGAGRYFKSLKEAKKFMKDRIIPRHPDAKIVSVVV